MRLLITCEHGGNRIPAPYRRLFSSCAEALASHRGYDPGALALARDFAAALDARLIYSTTSRLLVELNRSPRHRQTLSEFVRILPVPEREWLMQRYYWPYRRAVEDEVLAAIRDAQRVVHVSSHSFTPRLDGVDRRADIGLLYDPGRGSERELCKAWQQRIEAADGSLIVRRNYPYRGTTDGFTTHLRTLHADARYAGIEIEVNQKYPLGEAARWRALRRMLVATLREALAAVAPGR